MQKQSPVRDNVVSSSVYAKLVTCAGVASTVVAAILIIGKLLVLLLTQSSTILASLTDSLMDIIASIVNLVAIRYAIVPADEEHRFGHWKAESLAGLAQCAFIAGSAIFLLFHGFVRLFNPVELVHLDTGIYVTVFAIILTAGLYCFQTYVISKTSSQAIMADRLHYSTDVLFNIGVLISLGLSYYGFLYADGACAVLLSVYILYGAIGIGKSAISVLLDKQLPVEDVLNICKLLSSVENVKGVHDLRTRRSGPKIFILAHLEIDQNMPLISAHHVADLAENAVLEQYENADITLHMEPVIVYKNSIEG